jgi:hypothetical protein
MSAILKQAADHWRYVAPLLTPPQSEADYDALVETLRSMGSVSLIPAMAASTALRRAIQAGKAEAGRRRLLDK